MRCRLIRVNISGRCCSDFSSKVSETVIFTRNIGAEPKPAEKKATFPSETPAAAAYEAVNEDLSVCKSTLFGRVGTRSVAVSPGESQ